MIAVSIERDTAASRRERGPPPTKRGRQPRSNQEHIELSSASPKRGEAGFLGLASRPRFPAAPGLRPAQRRPRVLRICKCAATGRCPASLGPASTRRPTPIRRLLNRTQQGAATGCDGRSSPLGAKQGNGSGGPRHLEEAMDAAVRLVIERSERRKPARS